MKTDTNTLKFETLDDFLQDTENGEMFMETYKFIVGRTAYNHVSKALITSLFKIAIRIFDEIARMDHPELHVKEIVATSDKMYDEECDSYPSSWRQDKEDLYRHYPKIICKVWLSLYDQKNIFTNLILDYLDTHLSHADCQNKLYANDLIKQLESKGIVFHYAKHEGKDLFVSQHETMKLKNDNIDKNVLTSKEMEIVKLRKDISALSDENTALRTQIVSLQEQINAPDVREKAKNKVLLSLPANGKQKKNDSFSALIQSDDVKGTLEKLHLRIDGRGGKDVAMVLLKAKEDNIISRLPTEREFMSEFEVTSTWRAISNYLNPNKIVDFSSVTI